MTAKALLVDDRRENLVALEAILQGLAVETVAVTSGEEALKSLLVDDFAVILLDASMPTMDGFETATHIKQRERTRHIPIIFLTALDYDARLAFRGYQIGAVDFITKPFDPWVLRSKVAVFIDLWQKSADLTAQVSEQMSLQDAVTKSLALLASGDSDGAASVLRAAQAKHAVPRAR
jgi:CheY-like chemotaxis protein